MIIKTIRENVVLHRDVKTGIAWIANGEVGLGHSAHPNIDKSGSVRGMKDRGYWAKSDRTVKSHGFIYNIDRTVVSDELDEIARVHCQCGGNHK